MCKGEIIADRIHGLIIKKPFIFFCDALAAPSDFVGFGFAQYFSRLSNYCNWPKNGQK